MKKIYANTAATPRANRLKGILKPAWMVLILVVLGGGLLKAQVTVDAFSSGFTGANVTSITVSHTTGTANSMLMLVGVSYREGGAISVTYGDDPLDLVGSQTTTNNAKTYIFSMLNPPSGTSNVVVTNTGGDFDKGGIVGVMTFSGVDINSPLNTYVSSVGSTANPTLNNIPTSTNQLVFNVVALRNQNLTAVGSNQTQQWNIPSGDEMRGGGSTKTGDGATTSMSWTAAAGDWSMSAVSIKPIPVADLAITKTVNEPGPYAGETIQFTLTATNNGPDAASLVEVQDLLPSGFTYISHTAASGTEYLPGGGLWQIGNLANGAQVVLTINAIVNSNGEFTNTTTINGNVLDGTSGNNTSSVTIVLCQAGGTKPLFNQ